MQPTFYQPPSIVKEQQQQQQQQPIQNLPGNKFLDSASFNFKDTALIRPPFEEPKNKLDGHKYTRIVVDSRDRDRTLFPSPNKYEIELDTDVQDVVSGEVVIKEIPLSAYTINSHNNSFLFNGVLVSLPQGHYDAVTLTPVLEAALGGTLSIVYSAITEKYTWSSGSGSNSPFTIAFTEANMSAIALILGFVPGSSNTSNNGILVSPFCLNFAVDHYCVLRVAHFTINNSINPVLHKSTALIGQRDISTLRTMQPIKKYFNPIIARMTKLSISFTDFYGNPYDFHNKDHRLEILLESKKILTKYSAFV